MTERTTAVRLFGQETSLRYSETLVGYAVLALRLVMGWILFYAGITKLLDPAWSAEYLLVETGATSEPLAWLWRLMVPDWLWLVDPLNEWGETLIGLCFLLGAFVRIAAALGIVMMTLYYFAHLPLEWGFIIDFHIVYVLIMFGLAAFGAGRILGLDHYLERHGPLPDHWARVLLG
jgi:thiosulfate dehydrogenase [quinone] large subunit